MTPQKNRRRVESGYPSHQKDPRTGEDYTFHFARENLPHCQISTYNLKEMLVKRISGLSLQEFRMYIPH